MTQSQSRPRTPANWHPAGQEREGLWILTRLRDFVAAFGARPSALATPYRFDPPPTPPSPGPRHAGG